MLAMGQGHLTTSPIAGLLINSQSLQMQPNYNPMLLENHAIFNPESYLAQSLTGYPHT